MGWPLLIAAVLPIPGVLLGSVTGVLLIPFAAVAIYSFSRGDGGDQAPLGIMAMVAFLLLAFFRMG